MGTTDSDPEPAEFRLANKEANSNGHQNPLRYSVCLLPVATEQLLEVTALNRHSNYLPFWRSEVQTGNPGIKTSVVRLRSSQSLGGNVSPHLLKLLQTTLSLASPLPSSKPAVTALQLLLSSHMCSGCVFLASLFHP